MITTITLNPALDHYMIVDSKLIEDEVNRSNKEMLKAGGKGLNVSKVLSSIGIKSNALALIGGFSGEYIRSSFENREMINFIGIELEGITRINAKIYGEDKTICVNGNGPEADENTREEIRRYLNSINKDDYVMICGSKAKGLDDDFIVEMSQIVNKRNGRLVIDMESLTLEMIEKCKPYLIKPNLYEFKKLTGNIDITPKNIKKEIDGLLDIGLKNILISLGKDGALYANENEMYKVDQPEVNAINKVCCGDSMLATFVGYESEGKDIISTLKYATAAGISQACTMDEITMEMIESCTKDIVVKRIDL